MKQIFSLAFLVAWLINTPALAIEIDPGATIKDSPTSLMGVSHIGISVKNLDSTLAFYSEVTDFKLVSRKTVRNSEAADKLHGFNNIEYEVAVLEAPNMLFELVEYKHNAGREVSVMPVQGPGMTHTCFQSSSNDSVYEKFKAAGATMLSRGEEPVDLGGYGVYYAYGYDPEGNMFEMEILDDGPLAEVPAKGKWISEGQSSWMTQVALATHNIERLTNWYEKVLAFAPYRKGEYEDHPKIMEVADVDEITLLASWFRMNDRTKTLEFWEYQNPITPVYMGKRDITGFGYSYSIEVGDILAEYARMLDLGVEFVSEPVAMDDYWQVFAHDIDGNVFALRQWKDPDSPFSVPNLEL